MKQKRWSACLLALVLMVGACAAMAEEAEKTEMVTHYGIVSAEYYESEDDVQDDGSRVWLMLPYVSGAWLVLPEGMAAQDLGMGGVRFEGPALSPGSDETATFTPEAVEGIGAIDGTVREVGDGYVVIEALENGSQPYDPPQILRFEVTESTQAEFPYPEGTSVFGAYDPETMELFAVIVVNG